MAQVSAIHAGKLIDPDSGVVLTDQIILIRDNKIDGLLPTAIELNEPFDIVVAGGGFSGISAGRTFLRSAKTGQTCLLLENHAMTGGEAKRNEFNVDGYCLVGPQGSNLVIPPSDRGDSYDELWKDLGIPRNPTFQSRSGTSHQHTPAKAF